MDTSPPGSATRGLLLADRRGGPQSPPAPGNVTVHFAMEVDAAGVRRALYQRLAGLVVTL